MRWISEANIRKHEININSNILGKRLIRYVDWKSECDFYNNEEVYKKLTKMEIHHSMGNAHTHALHRNHNHLVKLQLFIRPL